MASSYVGRHRAAAGAASSPVSATPRVATGRVVRHAGATFALSATAIGGCILGTTTSAPGRMALADHTVALDSPRAVSGPLSTVRATTTLPNAADAPVSVSILDVERGVANRAANTRVLAVQAAQASAVQAAQAAAVAQQEVERTAELDRAARAAERDAVLANARANPKAVAQVMVAERGWNDVQFQCLVRLWTKESNWNYAATNRSSGAYGIPQSLPGSKMASVASDWRTNPVTQITWGLNYISSVYGTPCNAWGHSQRTNWY